MIVQKEKLTTYKKYKILKLKNIDFDKYNLDLRGVKKYNKRKNDAISITGFSSILEKSPNSQLMYHISRHL